MYLTKGRVQYFILLKKYFINLILTKHTKLYE